MKPLLPMAPLLMNLFILAALPAYASSQALEICAEDAASPPYHYGSLSLSLPKDKGASIDFMAALSARIERPLNIHFVPWRRCLLALEQEASPDSLQPDYHIALDATINQERLDKFYISTPIYKTNYTIFYMHERFPELPYPITAAFLNHYSLCGILGHNYDSLSQQDVTQPIDTAPYNIEQAFQRLQSHRCDFFITCMFTPEGGAHLGTVQIPSSIRHQPLYHIKAPTYHLLIKKNMPEAEKILADINNGILSLQIDGSADRIFKHYLPCNGHGLS